MMGISKRELFCDYYPDELAAVFEAWGELNDLSGSCDAEPVSVTAFLDM